MSVRPSDEFYSIIKIINHIHVYLLLHYYYFYYYYFKLYISAASCEPQRLWLKNIDCGYSLEWPKQGGSVAYHDLCFEQKYEKYPNSYLNIFIFCDKIFSKFKLVCFRNGLLVL